MSSDNVQRLFEAYSTVNYGGYRTGFAWFVHKRDKPLDIDYSQAIKDYESLEETGRLYAEDYLQSLFTESEIEQLRAYLLHNFDDNIRAEEIELPVSGSVMSVGAAPTGGGPDFYMLSEHESYNLSFKAWAYFDKRHSEYAHTLVGYKDGREPGQRCYDCGEHYGEPHTVGCDMERCGICGEQRLTCPCPAEEEETSKARTQVVRQARLQARQAINIIAENCHHSRRDNEFMSLISYIVWSQLETVKEPETEEELSPEEFMAMYGMSQEELMSLGHKDTKTTQAYIGSEAPEEYIESEAEYKDELEVRQEAGRLAEELNHFYISLFMYGNEQNLYSEVFQDSGVNIGAIEQAKKELESIAPAAEVDKDGLPF